MGPTNTYLYVSSGLRCLKRCIEYDVIYEDYMVYSYQYLTADRTLYIAENAKWYLYDQRFMEDCVNEVPYTKNGIFENVDPPIPLSSQKWHKWGAKVDPVQFVYDHSPRKIKGLAFKKEIEEKLF